MLVSVRKRLAAPIIVSTSWPDPNYRSIERPLANRCWHCERPGTILLRLASCELRGYSLLSAADMPPIEIASCDRRARSPRSSATSSGQRLGTVCGPTVISVEPDLMRKEVRDTDLQLHRLWTLVSIG